jgi:hypothetical protein
MGMTSATPATASNRRRSCQSATVLSAISSCWSETSAMKRISPMIDATGARTGGGRSSGSKARAFCRRSETSCLARKMSVPHSNSTVTTLIPIPVLERTRRTALAPFMAVSIGKVISRSTSSGDMPCASATMVTDGAVRSGKTSTGARDAVQPPHASASAAAASTSRRLCSDQPMMRSIKSVVRQCVWPWPISSPPTAASLTRYAPLDTTRSPASTPLSTSTSSPSRMPSSTGRRVNDSPPACT